MRKSNNNKSILEIKKEQLEREQAKLDRLAKRYESQKAHCAALTKEVKQLEDETIVMNVRNADLSLEELLSLLELNKAQSKPSPEPEEAEVFDGPDKAEWYSEYSSNYNSNMY